MVFAYLIHGPSRLVVDGLRLGCFILTCVLFGEMARYARGLWTYTQSVEWRHGVLDYQHRWAEHNKRLLGRIWLCVSWLFFLVIVSGTEIRRWGHDMGYWRLPITVLALASSARALHLLTKWNNLAQD